MQWQDQSLNNDGVEALFTRLTPDLLQHVLRHVEFSDRLRSCALVNTTWHAAATATTNSISISSLKDAQQCAAMCDWILKHSAVTKVSDLQLWHPRSWGLLLTVPLPLEAVSRLQSLKLGCMEIVPYTPENAAAGAVPGGAAAAAAAEGGAGQDHHHQQQQQQEEEVAEAQGGADVQLQQQAQQQGQGFEGEQGGGEEWEEQEDYEDYYCDEPGPHEPADVVFAVSQLTALTSLQLSECHVDLKGLAACQHLQHLQLDSLLVDDKAAADALAAEFVSWLPALEHLTSLELDGAWIAEPSMIPAVGKAVQLRVLRLGCCSAHWVQEWSSAIADCYPSTGPANQRDILSALVKLTNLQRLDLRSWMAPDNGHRASAADCAALTASSQLTYLNLQCWQVAPELCRQVFPAGRKLQQLQVLKLGPCFMQTPADAAAIAACCPSLKELDVAAIDKGASVFRLESEDVFRREVVTGACLDGLQSLPLQQLSFGCRQPQDSSLWGVLTQMTQLERLTMHEVGMEDLPNLLQLTALSKLQSLSASVRHLKNIGDDCIDMMVWCEVSRSDRGTAGPAYLRIPTAVLKCAASLANEFTESGFTEGGMLAEQQQLLDQLPGLCDSALQSWLQLHEGFAGPTSRLCERLPELVTEQDAVVTETEQVSAAEVDAVGQMLQRLSCTDAGSLRQLPTGQLHELQQQVAEHSKVVELAARQVGQTMALLADAFEGFRGMQALYRRNASELSKAVAELREWGQTLRGQMRSVA